VAPKRMKRPIKQSSLEFRLPHCGRAAVATIVGQWLSSVYYSLLLPGCG
jgi:hypothetical protein